jgi:2-dehydropantoate 2-reductase
VQDLVVIAVKAPALVEVARQIAPLIGPDTVVLTAMNGVPWWFLQGFGGALAGRQLQSVDPTGESAPSPAQVIGCVVHASCSLNGPGRVKPPLRQRPDHRRAGRQQPAQRACWPCC